MDVKSAKNYVFWLFCQFELITCSYLMEPWEKVLFYSFNTGMVGMLLYTTYACVAAHAGTALRLLWHCLGTQPDSAASAVK
ncbi:Serine palmitoyltransferase small subunit B [Willisornis vidua]|uniref:Serine palmitoyltransferase small subunit B n=1 Tax=Willisornis vidua TaxID=1566151 RepID=A0ABQ9DMQ6_9PASS|nr:Serine palmitoyltransferase small subunit B [Willisornis vidua]